MPKYYFDLYDGDDHTPDDEGSDCRDVEEARRNAMALSPDIAREVANHDVEGPVIAVIWDFRVDV